MANLIIQELKYGADAERSGATPVQFLPSMMLSWRKPIMAIHGLPAKAIRKAALDGSIMLPRQAVRQPG